MNKRLLKSFMASQEALDESQEPLKEEVVDGFELPTAMREYGNAQNAYETALESLASLTRLYSTLESIQAQPIDPLAIALATDLYDNASQNLGDHSATTALPALECFKHDNKDAVYAITMESVATRIGDAIKAIGRMIMDVLKKIADVIAKMNIYTRSLRLKIKLAREKIPTVAGKSAHDKKIPLGNSANALATEQAAPENGARLGRNLKTLEKVLSGYFQVYYPTVKVYAKELVACMTADLEVEAASEKLQKIYQNHGPILASKAVGASVNLQGKDPTYISPMLPGKKSILITVPMADGVDDFKLAVATPIRLDRRPSSGLVDFKDAEMELMSAVEMTDVLSDAEKLIDLVETAIKTNSINEAKKYARDLEETKISSPEGLYKYSKSLLANAASCFTKPYVELLSLGTTVASHAISTVNHHLAAYNEA